MRSGGVGLLVLKIRTHKVGSMWKPYTQNAKKSSRARFGYRIPDRQAAMGAISPGPDARFEFTAVPTR